MFADLHAELHALPDLAIVAVGGLPIERHDEGYALFGRPIDAARLRHELVRGIGLGAVLTYRNPKGRSLADLGELCLQRRHLWTAHVLSLTVVFGRAPLAVRNAFAFDRRFHLSWVQAEVADDPCTFTATGALREWARVIAYADDPSFSETPRQWFRKLGALLQPLLSDDATAPA